METFEIKDPRIDLKAAAMLDHYVGAIWWCKQQSFSAEQTSAFFTVIDTLTSNIGMVNNHCSAWIIELSLNNM
jgi:hypothetical protein